MPWPPPTRMAVSRFPRSTSGRPSRSRARSAPGRFVPPRTTRRARARAASTCLRCAKGDEDAIWSDEHWLVAPLPKPSGLPVVVILYPKVHCDLDGLPPERQAELRPLIVRVERAVDAVGNVERVHVGRWGDGSEHLHFWFMGRPARMPQLRMSFAAIWDDILPPVPAELWRASLAAVARSLGAGGGRRRV